MDISELEVLKAAEAISDSIWREISTWDLFAKDTVGKQLARSGDSIGANIAEAFGRYHYADKVRFFYYSRGSIFETKFWLNRCLSRELLAKPEVEKHLAELTLIAKRLNSLVAATRAQTSKPTRRAIKEKQSSYLADKPQELFNSSELESLETLDN